MSNRDRDNDRDSRRRGDDDEDRGSRRRDRDEDEGRSRRRSGDEDDRGSRRSSREDDDRGRGRDRDDDRNSRRRGDDDDRGSRRSSNSSEGFRYESRDPEATKRRGSRGNTDFDRMLADGVKTYKVADGDNRVRILPPTWKKAEHYALDIYVHYGVGPDKQSYLCPQKMKGDPCPICEERAKARDDGDDDYAKELEPKRRALCYVIDREHPKEGVQAFSMPWTLDNDIIKVSQDKSSGEVLQIDHPEEGYDVEFERNGKGLKTKYEGIQVARRSSELGKSEWLDYAVDNPLDQQLIVFSYDDIAKAFGGKGQQRSSRDRDRDDDDDRGSRRGDRDDDRSRGRDRDEDDRGSRRRGDDREERGGRSRSEDPERPTWESVHDMTKSELEDLIDDENLDINPKDAKDVEDLADWICEEMKLTKAAAREGGGRRRSGDDDSGDKLSDMRRRRSGDDDDDRGSRRRRDD